MAHVSPKTRQIRRLKRELTLTHRIADLAIKQRDEARYLANLFASQLDKLTNPDLTIKKIQEDNVENNQASGSDQDSSGLDVPSV